MFEEYSKRNKAIVAALELAAEGGWKRRDVSRDCRAQRREPRRPSPRLHLQDGHPQRLPGEVDAEVSAKSNRRRRSRARGIACSTWS
jgi:hypothetical protein